MIAIGHSHIAALMHGHSGTQHRTCPLCDGPAGNPGFPYQFTFDGVAFGTYACSACATRYVDPAPDQALLGRMYATGEYHDAFYDGDGPGAYADTVALLGRNLPAGARVLDYGCGSGHLVAALKQAGFQAEGAEFSQTVAANAAARTGCAVHDLSDPEWLAAGPWDCIHFGDVIEHLVEPRETVRTMLQRLRPGGILSVEGPLEANPSVVNFAILTFGWAKHKLRPDHRPQIAPYHLLFTSAAAQQAMFARLGEPLDLVHWVVDETAWPYRNNGALRHAIAVAALGVARLVPGWGNRFRALYRKAA